MVDLWVIGSFLGGIFEFYYRLGLYDFLLSFSGEFATDTN